MSIKKTVSGVGKPKDLKTSAKHSKAGASILKSLNEAIRWAGGENVPGVKVIHVPPMPDVKAIRKRMGMSQDEFARRFGFSASTLRNWEQGTRRPETTARILLAIIEREPGVVRRVLSEQGMRR